MLPPARQVKATTYRRDSSEAAKFCLTLIAETDARSVAIAILFVLSVNKKYHFLMSPGASRGIPSDNKKDGYRQRNVRQFLQSA